MPVQVRPAVPEAASGDNRPFWAIFLCKENSPQRRYAEALRLPGKLFPFFSAGLRPSVVSRGSKRDYHHDSQHKGSKVSEHKITSLLRDASLATKGYFRPLINRESLVV